MGPDGEQKANPTYIALVVDSRSPPTAPSMVDPSRPPISVDVVELRRKKHVSLGFKKRKEKKRNG